MIGPAKFTLLEGTQKCSIGDEDICRHDGVGDGITQSSIILDGFESLQGFQKCSKHDAKTKRTCGRMSHNASESVTTAEAIPEEKVEELYVIYNTS